MFARPVYGITYTSKRGQEDDIVLGLNLGAYLVVSLATVQDAEERAQAAAFVGVADTEPSRIPALLSVPEIERLIHLYVPAEEAEAVLRELLDGKATRELT